MRTYVVAVLALITCFGGPVSAWSGEPTPPSKIESAIQAIDACNHWAGETGDQTEERNAQIAEGIDRDCAEAKQKVIEVTKTYPGNDALLPSLDLGIDSGTLEASDPSITGYCDALIPNMKRTFKASGRKNGHFKSVCTFQAKQIYGE